MAAEDADAVQHRLGDQGARGQVVAAAMGIVHREPCRSKAGLRIRSDAADERDHGAYHYAAPAQCARTRASLRAQACRPFRALAQKGTGVLSEFVARNAQPFEE